MAKKAKRGVITTKNASALVSFLPRAQSGAYVTPRTSLTLSPVWQALDILTGDLSRMPFLTYKKTADGRGKDRADTHNVYRLLRRHTGEMTSNLWIARMMAHALLYGNGYSRIRWRGSMPTRLEWLSRDQVEPFNDHEGRYYVVKYKHNTGGSSYERVPVDDMFHLVGLTIDELGGLSLVDFARNTIGRQMSAEGYTDDFFGNDATPSGWFEHPGEMSESAQERFIRNVETRHRGQGKRSRAGILEEGMKWTSAGVNPKDAMLIDQLRLGVLDVARFFNIPPHKLGDMSRAAYNSLEQEEKSYYGSTLGKWTSRFEYEATYKCFLDSQLDEGYFCEFKQDSLLKADTAARFASYAIALQWGIFNPNEVRSLENMNPYEGGDEYQRPLTHAAEPTPIPQEDMPREDDARAKASMRDLLLDRLEAGVRLLANAATRAAKHPREFLARINELATKHRASLEGILSPAVRAAVRDKSLTTIVETILARASEEFLGASECQPEDLPSRVASAGESLRDFARELSLDLIYGGQQHGN